MVLETLLHSIVRPNFLSVRLVRKIPLAILFSSCHFYLFFKIIGIQLLYFVYFLFTDTHIIFNHVVSEALSINKHNLLAGFVSCFYSTRSEFLCFIINLLIAHVSFYNHQRWFLCAKIIFFCEITKDIGIEKNESGFIGKLNQFKWQSNPLYFAI